METSCILTCVYCGHEYPQDTPAWGNEVLTEHIKVCAKHPMRKLEEQNKKMRAALIGLVGAETKEELDVMEAAIRLMQIPDKDKMVTINAIDALREVL